MTAYDLLSEPWLTVLSTDGSPKQVGLREALENAESYTTYVDPDPGVEVSVLRLMVAIVQASIQGPEKGAGLPDTYPQQEISEYLDSVSDRFDLLSADKPFFQAPHAAAYESGTPNRLAFPFFPGGSKIMVASGYADAGDRMSPADAARYLICAQAWGNGQATSGPLPGGTNKSTPAGVLAGSLSVYPLGKTLAETLLLNTFPVEDLGVPVWEVEPGTAPSGWLGRLAWPARSYLLTSDEKGFVVGAHFSAGHPVPDPEFRDPHFIFRGDDGVYLRATSKKATWREVPVIYGWDRGGKSEQLEVAVTHLGNERREIERCVLYGRDNVGMSVASVQIRLVIPLPVSMLGRPDSAGASALRLLMKQTYDAVNALRSSLAGLDPEAAGQVWADCEPAYLSLVEHAARDPHDAEAIRPAVEEYHTAVQSICLSIFEEQSKSLTPEEYGSRNANLRRRLGKAFRSTQESDSKKEKS